MLLSCQIGHLTPQWKLRLWLETIIRTILICYHTPYLDRFVTMHVHAVGGGAEGKRGSQAGSTPSAEPHMGLVLKTLRS